MRSSVPVNTTVLPATGVLLVGCSRRLDAHLLDQPVDDAAVMRFLEIGGDRTDHGVADLVERIHLDARFLVALGDVQSRIMECLPGAVATRKRPRRRLADVTDTEGIDEAFE